MSASTKRVLSIFGAIAGLFYAFAALLNAVMPAWGRLAAIRADIAEKESARSELEQLVARAQDFLSQAGELERRAAPVDSALPRTPNLPAFVAILGALASENTVTISQLRFELTPYRAEPGRTGPQVSRVAAQASLIGRYPDVKALLRDVESELRLLDVESIDLQSTAGEAIPTAQTPVSASLRLTAYWQQ